MELQKSFSKAIQGVSKMTMVKKTLDNEKANQIAQQQAQTEKKALADKKEAEKTAKETQKAQEKQAKAEKSQQERTQAEISGLEEKLKGAPEMLRKANIADLKNKEQSDKYRKAAQRDYYQIRKRKKSEDFNPNSRKYQDLLGSYQTNRQFSKLYTTNKVEEAQTTIQDWKTRLTTLKNGAKQRVFIAPKGE